jgi:hypothetical protein
VALVAERLVVDGEEEAIEWAAGGDAVSARVLVMTLRAGARPFLGDSLYARDRISVLRGLVRRPCRRREGEQ